MIYHWIILGLLGFVLGLAGVNVLNSWHAWVILALAAANGFTWEKL